ncbi:MAG: protoporphyrinogen oxidase [Acidobacteria bacterium]|jgi:oxygen-dependent protoporphyrinogen oxidase|nr:protoporphyrinogen oxidase [Acidobacteriota bacterium]
MMKKVCVIGGGISGLCVAYWLKKKGVDVLLVERNAVCGGNIQTERDGDYLIEWGPNSTLVSNHLFELIAELGLLEAVAPANRSAKKRYILKDGKLRPLPLKIAQIIWTDVFSTKAKLSILREPFVKSKSTENESVAEFFRRRLGAEVADYAVDPFVSGIFAGNPEKLRVESAFPSVFQMEKDYGSILKASALGKKEKPSRFVPKGISRTVSFENGMQTLTDKLAENLLDELKTGKEVLEIGKWKTDNGKWKIKTDDEKINARSFDAVVIATPSFVAANLIENLDGELSEKLKEIYHPPLAVIVSAYGRENVKKDLDGFGFLIPKVERRTILGSLWSSVIFENRAPKDTHLLTTYIGGARNAELFDKTDAELFEIAREELGDILRVQGEPIFQRIRRWEKAIPQYNLGYEKIENGIKQFERNNQGIFFCSNFYRGISVGDCVKNSCETANEIEKFLGE